MAAADATRHPVGVVLAGGLGRRIGGDKAIVELEGRALALYPLEALHEVCDDVAVVAKRDTLLPSLAGVADAVDRARRCRATRWPASRTRCTWPAAGRCSPSRSTCRASTPRRCARSRGPTPAPAAVVAPRVHGRLQPLCALYTPAALAGLAAFDPTARATDVIEALGVREVEVADPTAFLNVNRPEDLIQAAVCLSGR